MVGASCEVLFSLSPNLHQEWWVLRPLVLWGHWDGRDIALSTRSLRKIFWRPGSKLKCGGSSRSASSLWSLICLLQFPTQHQLRCLWRCLHASTQPTNWWRQQVCAGSFQGKHPHFLNHNALDKGPRTPSRTQSMFSCPPLGVSTGTGCDVLRTKDNGHSLPSCRHYAPTVI